jgi:hypothetical protein
MIQAKPSPGRLAERFTVFCRGRLIRRTNAVGPQATLNGHKIKINVTSVNKTAGIIRRLCTLPGTSEISTVATDRPLLSMPDVIAPLLSVDEEAVLFWSEVALSSQLIVTLELAAIEWSLAVAMIAVSVLPPVSAVPVPSALSVRLLLFSTLATSVRRLLRLGCYPKHRVR